MKNSNEVTKLDYMDLISKESSVEGNFKFKNYLRLEGRVDGDIIASTLVEGNLLFVGPSAVVNGNIKAWDVVVEGTVRGDIDALGRLEIKPKGMVVGHVTTKQLSVHHGGILQGGSSLLRGKKTTAQHSKTLPTT